jgi:hypothetical protein
MNTRPEDILAEYAEGLVRQEVDLKALLQKYEVAPDSELEALLQLAASLEKVLVGATPTVAFVEALRQKLAGNPSPALLSRVRSLSTAQQIVAGLGGLTLAAGILWIARKSALDFFPKRLEGETETPPALAS